MARELTSGAKSLLNELQIGLQIAEAGVYPGATSFNDRAIAYLSNAAAMCRAGHLDDFRIYGALYGIRHGMELWLKCTIQNRTLDKALLAICDPNSTLDDIAAAAGQSGKKERERLRNALCLMRNICEDGLRAPECHEQNIGDKFAHKAIAFIRQSGDRPRYVLSCAWAVPTRGHSLGALWNEAKPGIGEMYASIAQHAHEHFGSPVTLARIEATCELFEALDPFGDAFRYPATLGGNYHRVPHFSLDRLAELADALEGTVRGYDSLLEDAYLFATLSNPRPNYASC